MSKTLSIVLTSILCFILVLLFVFGFFLSFEYGKYGVYHPAISLIQLGSEFGDKTVGTYKVDARVLEENEQQYDSKAQSNIQKIISSRLGAMYGYYGSKVSFSNSWQNVSIEIPKTTSHEGTTAEAILQNISVRGLVEICKSSTYSADDVVLSNNSESQLFRRASYAKFVEGGSTYCLITVVLTNDGYELMRENFTASASTAVGQIAIDEYISGYYSMYWPDTNSKKLSIYCNDEINAKMLVEFLDSGALPVKLHEISVEEVEANPILGIVVGIAVAALILVAIGLIFVKYKSLSLVAVISILATVVAVVYYAALVTFGILNIWAVVGFVIGIGVMCYCMINYFDKVQQAIQDGKSIKFSVNSAYKKCWLKNIIVSGAALVLGILLWLVPTGITAPLGNALVYVAIMNGICAFGLNYVLSRFFLPAIVGKQPSAYGVNQ